MVKQKKLKCQIETASAAEARPHNGRRRKGSNNNNNIIILQLRSSFSKAVINVLMELAKDYIY